MKRNMTKWIDEMIAAPKKKAMPLLSFPSVQKLNVSVKELLLSSDLQAQGMKIVADLTDSSAAVSFMDLSLEAECFGAKIQLEDNEVPAVLDCVVSSEEDADALIIPEVGSGRTDIAIEAIKKACGFITDRPVLAGVIGPFSLAGRLLDVTEAMIYCYDEPDMVHTVLDKVTTFLINYCNAFKDAGANGVVIAEPLAGLLSPTLAEEFSADYMKKLVAAVQTDEFIVVYHNCGDTAIRTIDTIITNGCRVFHFGNAIDMAEMMTHIPADMLAMGNVDPAGQFKNGTPESIRENTLEIMEKCCKFPNFAISSGCDIPPMSSWDNIEAFFNAVDEFYNK